MKTIVYDVNDNIINPEDKEIELNEYYEAMLSFSQVDECA